MKIKGYRRENGVYGIRNHIIVVSSVICANSLVERICRMNEDVIKITHQHGCDHLPSDRDQVIRTLVGIANHPNVGGVLLVGLGCENVTVDAIFSRISRENRIVKKILIQDIGNREQIVGRANEYIAEMKKHILNCEREEFGLSDLIVSVKCGGSDSFSGITANPAVGNASDRIVEGGGTVLLGEVPEMIGAQDALKSRMNEQNVYSMLISRMNYYIEAAKKEGSDLRGTNPTPGNIRAGISTLEEKSLGAIIKGGTTPIRDFIAYAQKPGTKGLVIMDTPGNDAESVTGMVAGGAHVVLFTTGLGTPLGNPIAPVIKISSNNRIFAHMRDFIDINAGKIVDGAKIEDIGQEIMEFLVEVCNGKKTASETNGSMEFSINRVAPTF